LKKEIKANCMKKDETTNMLRSFAEFLESFQVEDIARLHKKSEENMSYFKENYKSIQKNFGGEVVVIKDKIVVKHFPEDLGMEIDEHIKYIDREIGEYLRQLSDEERDNIIIEYVPKPDEKFIFYSAG